MMPKKILYLRTDLVSRDLLAGGSVSHTIGVINGFRGLGYSVVCASSCMKIVLEGLSLDQLKILKIPSWLYIVRWKLSCFFSNLFFFFQIFPLMKQKEFEFIYQRYSILNCVGVLLSKIKKVPLILEYNGSEVWVDRHWSQGRLLKFTFLIGLIEKVNIKHASVVVVVSQALKDDLLVKGIDSSKILVNPNGVDTNVYDSAKLVNERAEIRKKLNLEDKFIFGFIGTFSQWHGIEILADMIPQVCESKLKVHFLLIGEGPLKEFLENKLAIMAADAVTFVGAIPSQQAREYLAACDAFLCPTLPNPDGSAFFGSPTKIFEYMSMGRPIIASDIGQISELLRPIKHNGENENIGFLVPPVTDRFVSSVFDLLNLKMNEYEKLGNAARKRVQNYTWEKHVQATTHFFENMKQANV